MPSYQFLPEALVDLEDAASWCEDQRVGLGEALVSAFEARIVDAIETPGTGALAGKTAQGHDIRRYRLERFRRYAILLAIMDDVPTVIAFEHSSRRPHYWDDRVE